RTGGAARLPAREGECRRTLALRENMPCGQGHSAVPRGHGMTPRTVTNVPASVFARLKNAAQNNRVDVQFLLTRYFIERLLYRLACSPERPNFILKGAMLFAVWTGDLYRPSKDVDFLGRGSEDVASMIDRIRLICATHVPVEDGVSFALD